MDSESGSDSATQENKPLLYCPFFVDNGCNFTTKFRGNLTRHLRDIIKTEETKIAIGQLSTFQHPPAEVAKWQKENVNLSYVAPDKRAVLEYEMDRADAMASLIQWHANENPYLINQKERREGGGGENKLDQFEMIKFFFT
jgi:hypothetical protein